jgi:hypothetical protein
MKIRRSNTTRYFYHPESDCLFTTNGEYPQSDGLVEEVDRQQFYDIKKQLDTAMRSRLNLNEKG